MVAASTGRGGTVQVQKAAVWYEAKSPNPAEAEELGKLLRDRIREAGMTPAPLVFCIGRDRVILKELKYPFVQPHEEPQIVRHQVLKELTDAANDVVIDFVSQQSGPKEIRAQAVILRRELLDTFNGIARAAGLKLAGLTPRPFGAAVCLERLLGTTPTMPNPEPADAPIALVTVADKWAEFSVIRKGQLFLTRALNVGPNLAGEIRRNLAVHAGQNPQQPLRGVYLALSEAHENGSPPFDPVLLKQRLTEMVEIPVHVFDPFGTADGPEVPAGLRGSFAGAMGLLYGLAKNENLPINFVAPRKPAPPRNPNNLRYLLAAGLLLATGAVFAALGVLHVSNLNKQAKELERKDADLAKELAAVQTETKIEKHLETWETVVWLDELYELTAMAPKVDSDFKVTEVEGTWVARTARTPHVGQLTIKGTKKTSTPLKQLSEEMDRTLAEKVGNIYRVLKQDEKPNEFRVDILVQKRPPNQFSRTVAVPDIKKQPDKKDPVKKEPEKKEPEKKEPEKKENVVPESEEP